MNDVVPQYPWNEGDHLFASALNAAIADGPYMPGSIANVLYFGADPTGAADSTAAFRAALATGKNVYAPQGTYRITGQLTVSSPSQGLRGDGLNTVLRIDHGFDPSVTTGVIVLTAAATGTPQVSDLTIAFEQPTDLVKTSIAAAAAGTNTIALSDTTGIVVGMSVVDRTARPGAIPSRVYFTAAAATTVSAVMGDLVTLSANITSPGVANGDSIQFGSVRSMFKTLAAGGTAGVGGTGIQYPWAIYANFPPVRISNIRLTQAWNGIYIRASAFQIDKADVYAYNIGMDIDQCFNFPSINDYRFYPWGEPITGGPTDALANVYYDGATVAANFGQVDGVGVHNLQSWAGLVNLTAAWTWGEFTNTMLDGDNANLIITSSGNGFAHFSNGYSSKGNYTTGPAIGVNATNAGFRATFNNFSLTAASPAYYPVVLQGGVLQFANSYIWDGLTNAGLSMFQLTGGALYLYNMLLDSGGGPVGSYLNMGGNAALYMFNCGFMRPPAVATLGVSAGPNNPVILSNVAWNGWGVLVPSYNNNGAIFAAPLDSTSLQNGSLSFATLLASSHYNTGYGEYALHGAKDITTYTTAFGSNAGFGAQGASNTFIGAVSGFSGAGASGSYNTCLGAVTGYDLTSGANNTFIGYNVGNAITTGTGNLHIAAGANAFSYTATESHTFRLGDNAINVMRATNIDTATPHLFLDWLPATTTYANDAAAAAGGVLPGQLYRNGSVVQVRVV